MGASQQAGRPTYLDPSRGCAYWLNDEHELLYAPLRDLEGLMPGEVSFNPSDAAAGVVDFERGLATPLEQAEVALIRARLLAATLRHDALPAESSVEGFGPIPDGDHPDRSQRPLAEWGADHDWRVTAYSWGARLEVNVGGLGLVSLNLHEPRADAIGEALAKAEVVRS